MPHKMALAVKTQSIKTFRYMSPQFLQTSLPIWLTLSGLYAQLVPKWAHLANIYLNIYRFWVIEGKAIFICQGILYINILCLSACLLIHSCMPSPLAPDPIRVQSCVCCLFWTNRNSNIYLSIYLIIQVEINPYVGALTVNGNIYFYWNYSFVRKKQSGFVNYSF